MTRPAKQDSNCKLNEGEGQGFDIVIGTLNKDV